MVTWWVAAGDLGFVGSEYSEGPKVSSRSRHFCAREVQEVGSVVRCSVELLDARRGTLDGAVLA